MVNMLADKPSISRRAELKCNITSPDVNSGADRAPVRGHGLGFTMWYA